MNYSAWYATKQRNDALRYYRDLYKLRVQYKMIDKTVNITGCPPLEKIVKLEAKHEDFVDFYKFKETELLLYEWTPVDVPITWRGKELVTDSLTDRDEAKMQKIWRYSIALWAHNANMLRRAEATPRKAYDKFWSLLSSPINGPLDGAMIGDLPDLITDRSSS